MEAPTSPLPDFDYSPTDDATVVAPVVAREAPESELPITVTVGPRHARRVTVRIVDRKQGRPRPILSGPEE